MIRTRLAIAASALLLAAAAPPAAPVTPPPPLAPAPAPSLVPAGPIHPALWKVGDADTTIWLFGTIHALPPGLRWQDAAIEGAMADAGSLVIETMLDDDPNKAAALLYGLALTPGLPPLADRVRPADRARLAALVARSPVPAGVLDGMETWAAALVLTGVTLNDLGISGGAGVEGTIKAGFAAAAKPVSGLETPAQQLGFLDGLPEDEQRRLLATTLDDPGQARADYAAMLAAWAHGDEVGIARTFDEEAQVSPLLRATLLTKRNAAWADWIAARMARPGHLMVAVGAGHLAGAGSVPALLAARGLHVERVQ